MNTSLFPTSLNLDIVTAILDKIDAPQGCRRTELVAFVAARLTSADQLDVYVESLSQIGAISSYCVDEGVGLVYELSPGFTAHRANPDRFLAAGSPADRAQTSNGQSPDSWTSASATFGAPPKAAPDVRTTRPPRRSPPPSYLTCE